MNLLTKAAPYVVSILFKCKHRGNECAHQGQRSLAAVKHPKFQVLKSQNSKISKFWNPKIEVTSHNTHQSTIRCFYTIRVQALRKLTSIPKIPISQYSKVPKSQNSKISKFWNPKIEVTSHNTHQSTIRCFYTIRVQASRKRVRAPGPVSASSCQAPKIPNLENPKFQNFKIWNVKIPKFEIPKLKLLHITLTKAPYVVSTLFGCKHCTN